MYPSSSPPGSTAKDRVRCPHATVSALGGLLLEDAPIELIFPVDVEFLPLRVIVGTREANERRHEDG